MSDLTCVFYTCNVIPESFASKVREQLLKALGDIPLISVSHKPMDFGKNIVVDLPRSHFSIYRSALVGAKAAKTKYVSFAEDDTIYSKEHFDYTPKPGVFAYDKSIWSLFTWSDPPMFSHKDRRTLNALICERNLFIEAIEERFARYPNPSDSLIKIWGEPAKYESQLGVTVRQSEIYYSKVPIVVFSHERALGFRALGTRKKLGHHKAFEIPHYGRAEDLVKWFYAKD